MHFSKLAIAAVFLVLGLALPALAEEDCREGVGYVLCFDNDWLRYYNQIEREFDWRNYIENEEPRQASDYYRDVNLIYIEVLGREADVEGLNHWSQALANGMALSDIRREIANSPEVEAELDRIYQEILGREVDSSGLQTWTTKLARGSTLGDIRQEIELSEEAAARGS